MLVGHLPHLARLAGLLLTGSSDRSVIRFCQGGLVGLEQTHTGWMVREALRRFLNVD
jgi:phosphohistidine phosphatase